MAAPGNIQQVDQLDQLTKLLTTFKGTSQKETTQTKVSKPGMDRILQQALEGRGGLADTIMPQRKAGLYNAPTNQLLVNDLLTRMTGEAARLSSPTTRNLVTPPKAGIADLAKLMAVSYGAKALNPAMKAVGQKLGISKSMTDGVAKFTGATGTAATAAEATANLGGSAISMDAISSTDALTGDIGFSVPTDAGASLTDIGGSGFNGMSNADVSGGLTDFSFDGGSVPWGSVISFAQDPSGAGAIDIGLNYMTGGLYGLADAVLGGGQWSEKLAGGVSALGGNLSDEITDPLADTFSELNPFGGGSWDLMEMVKNLPWNRT